MQESIKKLSLQFLCGLPLNEISINVNLTLENQEALLNTTVNSELVLKYPLKIAYQKAFLKYILQKLEEQDLEIHEDFYSAYGRLVAVSESISGCFKHYRIGNSDTTISLTENVHLISEGTTGLRTWQASLALAEWCLHNRSSLFNKSVLELGSGIGLTGLAACLECKPRKFCFSDCHPSVLKTLNENIDLNCKNCFTNRQHKSGVKISVLNLPWEEVDNTVCAKIGEVDLILAADVVYDSTLFKPLIQTLKCFAEVCQVEDIVLACTERNPETLKTFLQEIGDYFNISLEDSPIQCNFVWSATPPVRIFRFKLL